MLEIKDLHAEIDGKEILKGFNLTVPKGEIHAIMGPNGSGKSTLAYVLAGKEDYEVTAGSITWDGKNLLEMEPNERAHAGVFLAFQYPMEIPGVASLTFLRTALNAQRRARGEGDMPIPDFMRTVRTQAEKLGMSMEMLKRPVNTGFSGGEKKRHEVLQMALLQPTLCILDETDSGTRHRCDPGRGRGGQRIALAGPRHCGHHALSAPLELHRARQGACHGARPDFALRREGTRAGARRVRVRGLRR